MFPTVTPGGSDSSRDPPWASAGTCAHVHIQRHIIKHDENKPSKNFKIMITLCWLSRFLALVTALSF